jgi:adenylate cyclase
MAEEGFKRKLTAILSADAEGYSRLMGDDEEATVRTLTAYREVMTTLIQQHNGKVLDSPGDNLLAEFVSVVDAVQCAVAVQKEIKARNDQLPEDRRMLFRIGINLGDVIQEKGRIYGDGVNIAARLEGLAEPGGICISKTAFDHIESKLPYGYDFIGDQSVKNIAKPVGAYRVLMDPRVTVSGKPVGEKPSALRRAPILVGVVAVLVLAIAVGIWQFYARRPTVEPASIEKMAFPLPDKPSIAVLPFDNLSGDQSDEYIADGLSENIISSLSKIPDMLVIARNSTFVYKGKAVKVNQVAEELGVRYVLEGSIQKSGENLRVTAQLVDAITGYHLWSERYDRDTKDFFSVQDDITRNIVVALQVELTEGEQARIWHATENLEAWGYATKGIALMQLYTKEKNAKARELFKKAAELDPNYAFAWISIAWTHGIDSRFGFSESRGESFKRCIEFTQKTAKLNDSMPEVHSTWNFIYMLQRQYDKAIAEGKKAVALAPSDATSHMLLSLTLHFAGRFEESIFHIKEAMRLDPYYPPSHLGQLGNSYSMTEKHEKAIAVLEKRNERAKSEGSQLNYTYLVYSLVSLGQIEEANALAAEQLKLDPSFSLENWQKSRFYKDPADLDRLLNALRKAGLPE